MQPILFWKDIIFVTRKILIIEYKNALKCCPAAMLPNLLCTCSTEYRLYNVLVWSEKMNTMQFFPNEMKNKISIVIPFLYILKIILKPFCILFFFSGQNYYGAGSPNFANWWCSDVFVAKRNGRVLFGYSALELLAPAQHRSPNFYLCDVMPSSWVNVWKIYREFNIRPRSCWNLKSYKSLSQNVKDVFIQSIFKILD